MKPADLIVSRKFSRWYFLTMSRRADSIEPTLAGIVDMIGPLPQHHGAHGGDLYPTVHLDRGYDSGKTRDLLEVLGFHGEIAVKGVPAPLQVGRRWPVERTDSWMNG